MSAYAYILFFASLFGFLMVWTFGVMPILSYTIPYLDTASYMLKDYALMGSAKTLLLIIYGITPFIAVIIMLVYWLWYAANVKYS